MKTKNNLDIPLTDNSEIDTSRHFVTGNGICDEGTQLDTR